jgi:hypothetical protein
VTLKASLVEGHVIDALEEVSDAKVGKLATETAPKPNEEVALLGETALHPAKSAQNTALVTVLRRQTLSSRCLGDA